MLPRKEATNQSQRHSILPGVGPVQLCVISFLNYYIWQTNFHLRENNKSLIMLISHRLKSLCVDSTCTVICPLGQPPFCFPSLCSSVLLLCEGISDCPALDHTTHCLCRTNSEPALLLDIPLCDSLSSLQSCSDSYLKEKMYFKKEQSVVIKSMCLVVKIGFKI